jgi:Domain of unknown function (DUF4111)
MNKRDNERDEIMAHQPTAFPELNTVLSALVSGIQATLGDALLGVYLQGSFALGAGDADSDVDFIAVLRHAVPDAAVPALQALHGRLYDLESNWAKHLEGSYFPADLLRRPDPDRTELLFLDNGSRELVRSKHCNTLVVRWLVREHGIPLLGPPPTDVIDPVVVDDLRREVIAKMRAWAADYFATPSQLNTRWHQPYAVIMFCRMLHTLHTGRVASKPAAIVWGQQSLDPQWAGLLQRAWADRPDPSWKIRQPADPAECASTLAFIRYALTCIEGDASLMP